MSNRIAHYLPASNRISVAAPAVVPACGGFVALGFGPRLAVATATAPTSVYEIALQAARVQVAAKRRFRASLSTRYLEN